MGHVPRLRRSPHPRLTQMRYIIDLPSPDFELMLDGLRSACVHKAAYGADMLVRYGRLSPRHLEIKAQVDRLNRAIEILEEARNNAIPERATANPAVTYMRPIDSDDHERVAGRPRSDPRTARSRPKQRKP